MSEKFVHSVLNLKYLDKNTETKLDYIPYTNTII